MDEILNPLILNNKKSNGASDVLWLQFLFHVIVYEQNRNKYQKVYVDSDAEQSERNPINALNPIKL